MAFQFLSGGDSSYAERESKSIDIKCKEKDGVSFVVDETYSDPQSPAPWTPPLETSADERPEGPSLLHLDDLNDVVDDLYERYVGHCQVALPLKDRNRLRATTTSSAPTHLLSHPSTLDVDAGIEMQGKSVQAAGYVMQQVKSSVNTEREKEEEEELQGWRCSYRDAYGLEWPRRYWPYVWMIRGVRAVGRRMWRMVFPGVDGEEERLEVMRRWQEEEEKEKDEVKHSSTANQSGVIRRVGFVCALLSALGLRKEDVTREQAGINNENDKKKDNVDTEEDLVDAEKRFERLQLDNSSGDHYPTLFKKKC